MLETFSSDGQFYRGNLHGHSTNSDGDLTPEQHCRFYQQAGYDFVCLSDHFRYKYEFLISDTSPFRKDDFTTIIGAELHTGRMGSGEIWHFLAVGLPLDFEPPSETETAPDMAARALNAGAFLAYAHPEWNSLTLEDALSMPEGMHAVEVFNTASFTKGRGEGSALLDQLLNSGRRPCAIAVDDVHRYHRDALGGWVMVKAVENTPEALLQSLKRGLFYASTGADLINVERHGDFLHVECSPVDSVWLLGHGAKVTWVDGEGITRAKLPLDKFKGGYARLSIQASNGARAWSNPLFMNE